MKRMALTVCGLVGFAALSGWAHAQEIWTGPDMVFTKANFADWTLAENQDRITDGVWLTRQNTQGLFNIAVESSYDRTNNTSPAGTEWAVGDINDWDTLNYESWFDWAGGRVGQNILSLGPSVVHLIDGDIYIPIEFTAWTTSAAGGGFSYTRATEPNPPVEASTWSAIKALYD